MKKQALELTREGAAVPRTISVHTRKLQPLLSEWRQKNLRVPWSCLLQDALSAYLGQGKKKKAA